MKSTPAAPVSVNLTPEQAELDLPYMVGLSAGMFSPATMANLLTYFGSAHQAWTASSKTLTQCLGPKKEATVAKLIALQKRLDPQRMYQQLLLQQVHLIPQGHAAYPPLLMSGLQPPALLYVKGNLGALSHQPSVAMVGTRNATHYGQKVCQKIIEELKPFEACIVSGLANGVDTFSHQAALAQRMPTLAVFGTGLDRIFPSNNQKLAQQIVAEGGALLTELPLGVSGTAFTFPNRNRIIAGLSVGVLLVEAPAKSGALITARNALDTGRVVMATPGNLFSAQQQGCHQLIQEGAHLVTSGQDVWDCLQWGAAAGLMPAKQPPVMPIELQEPAKKALPEHFGDLERVVYACLGVEPVSLEQLADQLPDCSVASIQQALTLLELEQLVQSLPGKQYLKA